VESIRNQGIITPATVRKKNDGRYELVSGHRRMRACEILGIPTLKCEVMNLSKEEATIFMVESNFQRSTILPSEKAFAYKMRLEAMKMYISRMKENQQKGRNFGGKPVDEQLRKAYDHLSHSYGMSEAEVRKIGTPESRRADDVRPVGAQGRDYRSDEQLAKVVGDSARQIQRYIRQLSSFQSFWTWWTREKSLCVLL